MLVREQMSVNLPKAQSGEKSVSEQVTIVIEKEGKILIDQKQVSFDEIESVIKALLLKNPSAQAVISADTEAKHGDVVKVMDLVKQAGLTRFAIQIERQ